MTKRYKIVETDNFGGDHPRERLATPYLFSVERASEISELFNHIMSGPIAPRYWKPVPEDYVLDTKTVEDFPAQKAYVKTPVCPHCGSEDLQWIPDVEFNGSFLAQPVQCLSCDKGHQAIYDLSGYEVNV